MEPLHRDHAVTFNSHVGRVAGVAATVNDPAVLDQDVEHRRSDDPLATLEHGRHASEMVRTGEWIGVEETPFFDPKTPTTAASRSPPSAAI